MRITKSCTSFPAASIRAGERPARGPCASYESCREFLTLCSSRAATIRMDQAARGWGVFGLYDSAYKCPHIQYCERVVTITHKQASFFRYSRSRKSIPSQMAEVIGVASALLALASFAFHSSTKLCKTIQSFSSHPRQVRELLTELRGLVAVLQKLSQLSSIELDVDLTALEVALKQCHETCRDFESELIKYSSRCTGNRTDFRDWAKFKFRGSDSIDGFRQQLVGYKATISVALGVANL